MTPKKPKLPPTRKPLFVAVSKSRDHKRHPTVQPGLVVAGRNASDPHKVGILLPLYTTTESNAKGHWGPKQERARIQRETARLVVRSQNAKVPCVVAMTRCAFGEMDDDNLPSALKHVRDGVADALGVDDRDKRVKFTCAQKTGPRGYYAVEVEIVEAAGAELLPIRVQQKRARKAKGKR